MCPQDVSDTHPFHLPHIFNSCDKSAASCETEAPMAEGASLTEMLAAASASERADTSPSSRGVVCEWNEQRGGIGVAREGSASLSAELSRRKTPNLTRIWEGQVFPRVIISVR